MLFSNQTKDLLFENYIRSWNLQVHPEKHHYTTKYILRDENHYVQHYFLT